MLKKNITALEVVVLAECLKLHLTSGDTLHFLNDNCKYMYKKKTQEKQVSTFFQVLLPGNIYEAPFSST